MPVWVKMTLRLPHQVHSALTDLLKDKPDTSLNQEIVDRLNASLGGVYVSEVQANDANVIRRIERLEAEVAKLKRQTSK